MTAQSFKLRLGTRGSMLARVQSRMVADELERRHPGLEVELCVFKTTGDQIADRPLHEAGGKGLFVKELEQALLEGQVDLAVHSFKDVPVTMPLVDQTNLTIAAIPLREDPRDVLISLKGRRLADLPPDAKIGTGSMRRQSQIAALRSDVQIEGIRGNIDTRIRKLRSGEFDAVILAMAGIKRAGLFDADAMTPIDVEEMLPAAGQAALAIQCRRDDQRVIDVVSAVHDKDTALCVEIERELVRRLAGDCFSPIAVLAQLEPSGAQLRLRAAVAGRGGKLPILRAGALGNRENADQIVGQVFQILSEQGVQAHLHG